MAVTSPPADISPPCCQELKNTGNVVPVKTQMGSSHPPQPCALGGPCFGAWLGPAASEKPPGAFGFMDLTLTSGSTECAPHVALTPLLPLSPRAWACKASMLQGYTLGSGVSGWPGGEACGSNKFLLPPQALLPSPLWRQLQLILKGLQM